MLDERKTFLFSFLYHSIDSIFTFFLDIVILNKFYSLNKSWFISRTKKQSKHYFQIDLKLFSSAIIFQDHPLLWDKLAKIAFTLRIIRGNWNFFPIFFSSFWFQMLGKLWVCAQIGRKEIFRTKRGSISIGKG